MKRPTRWKRAETQIAKYSVVKERIKSSLSWLERSGNKNEWIIFIYIAIDIDFDFWRMYNNFRSWIG